MSTFRNDRRNDFKKAIVFGFIKSVLTHARGPFKLYRYKNLAELDLLSKSMQGLEQRVFCFSIVIIYGPTGS